MVGLAATLARSVLLLPAATRRVGLATMSWVKEVDSSGVTFINSFADPSKMPRSPLPEITLVGRSNVGKSSALNCLSGRRKKVAQVSKTPGRTRLINLFSVGKACMVTDLPGYGFAKVSADMQEEWRRNVEAYLRSRENLRVAVVFVDSQREPQQVDAQILDFLVYNEIPALVVATKTDKLKASQLQPCLAALRKGLELPPDQPIPFSSVTDVGRKEVWNYLERMCSEQNTNN
eukprot:scaffold8498_cov105-Isochrysis_galbana.AAC.3